MRAVVKAREVVPLATSPEQLGGLRSIGSTDQGRALDAGLARQEEADRLGAPHRVAPGIVVIPTPQVRTGSRMIYARLGNDREYLFTGTIAPVRTNWAMLRLPAQLVTDLGRRKDRQA
ncbi:MAG: hypothetical protein FJX31_08740, partial [Alphaproteobacteria bacterium]|nr:hypothetical protein [Alphaproteobacteria bacterium]